MKKLSRITFNPNIMGGQACIRDMRIPVSLIINLVANDMTTEEIIKEYTDIEPEDIKESLKYASCDSLRKGAILSVDEEKYRIRLLPINR